LKDKKEEDIEAKIERDLGTNLQDLFQLGHGKEKS